MSDLETRLSDALHADVPPARDAVFRVDVLVRLEHARFRRQVRRRVAVATLFAALAGLAASEIDGWVLAADSRIWLVALGAAGALCVLTLVMVVPGLRRAASAIGRLPYP
jgi:hypothetical protein